MKTLFIFIGAAFLVVVAALVFKSRVTPPYQITADQIPLVLTELSATSARPAFAVFMVSTPDQPNPDDRLEIEFSLESEKPGEGEKPGFDWVLATPLNNTDENRFADFARAAGFTPVVKEKNGVRYLRVEGGDLAGLCRDVVTKMYRRRPSEPITLIVEGFAWKP